jgi:hypothetical protein
MMDQKTARKIFFTTEVNVLLWIAAAFTTGASAPVIIGLVVAAVLQHWAYHGIYKPARQLHSQAGSSP